MVRSMLEARGFETRSLSAGGHPAVYAEWRGVSDKTLICYGHYIDGALPSTIKFIVEGEVDDDDMAALRTIPLGTPSSRQSRKRRQNRF